MLICRVIRVITILYIKARPIHATCRDVSYFRLKNLQFGYNLPKKWIAKAGFSKVSVYFSGENLWSWSPLYRHTKDYDVTVITKGSDNDLTSGNKGDGFNYPTMRNLSLGISITY